MKGRSYFFLFSKIANFGPATSTWLLVMFIAEKACFLVLGLPYQLGSSWVTRITLLLQNHNDTYYHTYLKARLSTNVLCTMSYIITCWKICGTCWRKVLQCLDLVNTVGASSRPQPRLQLRSPAWEDFHISEEQSANCKSKVRNQTYPVRRKHLGEKASTTLRHHQGGANVTNTCGRAFCLTDE